MLFYGHATGFLDARISNHGYANYDPGAGLVFRQARMVAELGATPWSKVKIHAPASQRRLATFSKPPGPPFIAEIATYSGDGSCVDSWWAHHRVKLTSDGTSAKRVEAQPRGLSNRSCNFSVYLKP